MTGILCWFDKQISAIQENEHGTYKIFIFFVFGLLHLAECPLDSSTLQQVSACPFFSRLNNIPLCVFPCLAYPFIHQWAFGLFSPLSIVSEHLAFAINIGVQISVQVPAFNSFVYIPRSVIDESFSCCYVQSCLTLFGPTDCSLPGSFVPEIFPGKNIGVGCHFLLQRIFPTQRWNPHLLHCRQILYH